MNTEILTRMSLDGLRKLEAAIKVELEARLDYSLRPGRTAWFTSSRADEGGSDRHVVIERINPKTVSCKELGDSVKPGMNWKVPAAMLRVDPVERNPASRAAARPSSSRPATAAAGAWA